MENETLDEFGPHTTVPINMELQGSFDGRIIERIVARFVEDNNGSDPVDTDTLIEAVVESSDFEYATVNIVEDWYEGSDVYNLSDRVDDLTSQVEAIYTTSSDNDHRLDTLEDKLLNEDDDLSGDSQDSLSILALRVSRLEQINERLLHIIHNIQGVELP